MKYLALSIFVALAVAGCSKQDGSNACSSSSLQDPFTVGGKVQISTGSGVASVSSGGVASMGLAQSIQSAPAQQSDRVPGGKELVAVVRESCVNQGSANNGYRSVPWKVPRDMTVGEIENQVRDDNCITGISDNVTAHTSQVFGDPMEAQQTHLKTIDASSGNDIYLDPNVGIKKDVVIAIIDSGVEYTHSDLKDNMWINTKETPGNGVDDDHNGYIDDVYGYNFANMNPDPRPATNWAGSHHGTHVAGLAAARGGNNVGVAGVMGQHAKIMALNVFGTDSGAATTAIDNAIRYAADNGADVINMSLGGPGRATSTEQAITYALSKGATIVVAAGNENVLVDNNFSTPASFSAFYTGVIAVGSVDVNSLQRSYFSDWGLNTVKIGAPGSDSVAGAGILSTMPGNSYGRLQGTSMASPVTAGGAALAVGLMRSRGRKATPSTVEWLLLNSAKVMNNLAQVFKGGRLLNVGELARLVDTRYPATGAGLGDGEGGGCQ